MLCLRPQVVISVFFTATVTLASSVFAKNIQVSVRPVPLAVGSIGDSISVAFNSANWGNNVSLSWATGDKPEIGSIATRLRESQGGEVKTYNFAVAGATAHDLLSQVGKVMEKNPNFVTMLIGPNDLCDWQDDHQSQLQVYERDIKAAIASMIEKKADVKILMAAIPDMHRMYEVGLEKGCSARWEAFRICPRLLGSAHTDLDRQHFVERWHDANNSLASVAAQYPDNVDFLAVVQNYQFGVEDISGKDCFHPSVVGQTTLAREAWNSRWFDAFSARSVPVTH